MLKRQIKSLLFLTVFPVFLLALLFNWLQLGTKTVFAAPIIATTQVGANEICFVEATGDDVTDFSSLDASAVQDAVNAANADDVLKVAGTCAGTQAQSGFTQTVYINRDITLQGGYTHTNWTVSNPETYTTTLDAEGNGRVLYIPDGDANPLAYWKLDEGSGTIAGDSSGNGHDMSLIDGLIYTNTTASLSYANPYALSFDGIDDYGTMNSVANAVGNEVTMAFWVKAALPSGDRSGLVAVNTASGGNVVIIMLRSSSIVSVWDGGDNNFDLHSTATAADDSWYHVAYTSDGSTGSLYVDGVFQGTHAIDYAFSADDLWSVGQEFDGGSPSDFLAGQLDDIRIYNYILTTDDIEQLANGFSPVNVVLDGVILQNGYTASDGAGIYSQATLTLTNNIVRYNQADSEGAGLYGHQNGAGTFISNTTFISNAAGDGGGGFYAHHPITITNSLISHNTAGSYGAGGMLDNAPDFLIQNSDILSNTNTFYEGGGLYIYDSQGAIQATRVLSNTALGSDGGGIYLEANAIVSLQDSQVAYNQADDGGGIYLLDDSYLSVLNSTILHNQTTSRGGGIGVEASFITGTQTTIAYNIADTDGGGVHGDESTIELHNSTVSHNHAGGSGGAIYVTGSILQLQNSQVVSNTATSSGGGLASYSNSTVDVTHSTFMGNVANASDFRQGGGGIYSASPLTVQMSTFINNAAVSDGGGIYNYNNTATVQNSAFISNTAGDGGGLRHYGVSGGWVVVENSTLSGNTVSGNGGGIYVGSGTITVTYSTLSGNSASDGGGIDVSQGPLHLGNSIIGNSPSGGDCIVNGAFNDHGYNLVEDAGNACGLTDGTNGNIIGTDPNLAPLADNGGDTLTHAPLTGSPLFEKIPVGVNGCGTTILTDQRGYPRPYNSQCDIGAVEMATLNTCMVDVNQDGVIDFSSADSTAVQQAIDNATDGDTLRIAGTCAGVQNRNTLTQTAYISKSLTLQGGYSADGNWTFNPEVYSTTLDADESGRVVVVEGSNIQATLSHLILLSGYAGDGTLDNDGAGLWTNGHVILQNSSVMSNTASDDGGGIFIQATGFFTGTDNNIAYNRANGTFVSGGGLHNKGYAHLQNMQITGNVSNRDAGGVYNYGVMTMVNTAVISNSGRYGGGIQNFGDLTVVRGQIIDNHSNQDGGGIHNWGTLVMTQSLVAYNIANDDAGGIYNIDQATIINSTISHNQGQGNVHGAGGGGLVVVQDGTVPYLSLQHTTVVSNSHPNGGEGLRIASGTADIQNSLIAHNGSQNCVGGSNIQSGGYNLEDSNTCNLDQSTDQVSAVPLIDNLKDNGGNTPTHALLSGSPAIDWIPAGTNGCGTTLTADQRGVTRPIGSGCDIGAYERELFIFIPLRVFLPMIMK